MATIESDVHKLQTSDAVAAVHRQNVEARLGSIEGGISRIFWSIVGAVVLAGVAFVIDGGLV